MKHTIQCTLTAIFIVLCFLVEVEAQKYQPDANPAEGGTLWHFNEASGSEDCF